VSRAPGKPAPGEGAVPRALRVLLSLPVRHWPLLACLSAGACAAVLENVLIGG